MDYFLRNVNGVGNPAPKSILVRTGIHFQEPHDNPDNHNFGVRQAHHISESLSAVETSRDIHPGDVSVTPQGDEIWEGRKRWL